MLAALHAASRFDPGGYMPLRYRKRRIGWLEPLFAYALSDHPAVFAREADSVQMLSPAGLDTVVRALAAEGWITGWRDERHDVRHGSRVLFSLERAAFRRFGFLACASHLNGWVR
jgi:hypothetical protein